MKFKKGDKVAYVGDNQEYKKYSFTVLKTRETAAYENDITRGGQVEYPKPGYDYTIQYKRFGLISAVLDVTENELKAIN